MDEHTAILSAAAYADQHTAWCEVQAQRMEELERSVRRGQALAPREQMELLRMGHEHMRRSGQLGVQITTMLATLRAPFWLRCWAWLSRRPVPRRYGGS